MVHTPVLFPLPVDVDVSAILHAFLCEVEVISLGIVRTKRGKGTIARTSEHSDLWIVLFDSTNGLIDVVDVEAEMMQSGIIARLSPDDRHADVTVADAESVICAYGSFF